MENIISTQSKLRVPAAARVGLDREGILGKRDSKFGKEWHLKMFQTTQEDLSPPEVPRLNNFANFPGQIYIKILFLFC